MNPYLYHGIRDYNLSRLINILDTGFILPKKMLPDSFKIDRKDELDLTGKSWISLCQKTLYDDFYKETNPSAFEVDIFNHICAVIDNNIDGLHYTNHLLLDFFGPKYIMSMVKDDSEERYSTYLDEVQTKNPVPTSKFIAIGYPKSFFEEHDTKRNVTNELDILAKKLKEKNLNIPIVDSSYYDFADDEEQIKKLTIR